jgi:phospholipid transport system transporter-binding protein
VSSAAIRLEGGILHVSGELTFATVTPLLRQSHPLFAQAGEHITVELGEVARADSAGLALLIEWMRQARAQGRSIHFSHLPEQLLAIANASDLDAILPLTAPQ